MFYLAFSSTYLGPELLPLYEKISFPVVVLVLHIQKPSFMLLLACIHFFLMFTCKAVTSSEVYASLLASYTTSMFILWPVVIACFLFSENTVSLRQCVILSVLSYCLRNMHCLLLFFIHKEGTAFWFAWLLLKLHPLQWNIF